MIQFIFLKFFTWLKIVDSKSIELTIISIFGGWISVETQNVIAWIVTMLVGITTIAYNLIKIKNERSKQQKPDEE